MTKSSGNQPSRLSWLGRRRFQFRLRTLLLLTTLVAVALSFVSRPLARYRRQRPAVATVNRLGGTVGFEHTPALGESLFSLVLGHDIYRVATEVDLHGPAVTDTDIEALAPLEDLRRLSLGGTGITDEGLKHVGRMHNLESLVLSGTAVTDDGLKAPASLKNLTEFDLSDTQVTDAGLPALEALRNLQRLHLAGTATSYEAIARLDEALPATEDLVVERAVAELRRGSASFVSADGQAEAYHWVRYEWFPTGRPNVAKQLLRHLAYLPELRKLDLHAREFRDPILSVIPELPGLRELNLSSSWVTNAGLAHLDRFKGLEVLNLQGIPIDDEGLSHLPVLQGLKRLNLGMTSVTGRGLAEIKRLPLLEHLDMEGIELVYDCDLAHLEESLALETLDLSHARVVGPGLPHLAGLLNLRNVTLAADWADQGAVDRLRKELGSPQAEVKLHAGPAPEPLVVGYPSLLASKEAEQCFWSGDYERLVDVLGRSESGSPTEWTELVQLGHALRLSGDIDAAVAAYHDAMDAIGQEIADVRVEPEATYEQRRWSLVEPWTALAMLLGQLELKELDDPDAAIRTFSGGVRFLPQAERRVPDLAAAAAAALDGLESPGSPRPSDSESRYSVRRRMARSAMATQTALARAYERQGNLCAAVECWTRVRLSNLVERTWKFRVDPCHLARLWARLSPEDMPAALPLFAHISDEHPSATIRPDRGESRLAWWGHSEWNLFGVVPPPGKALARIELTCAAREPDQTSIGPLFCWIGAQNSAAPGAVSLFERYSAKALPPGSIADSVEFDVPYDADVMFIHFASDWTGQGVSEVTVEATLRARGQAQPMPEPARPKPDLTDAGGLFEVIALDGPAFDGNGLQRADVVELPDGQWLMAFTAKRRDFGTKIMLSRSRDGQMWEAPWPLEHNSVYSTAHPSMAVDNEGDVWMLFTSSRLDLERFSSGRYLLWLSRTSDGRTWTRPVPVRTAEMLQDHTGGRITRGPDGRFWIFCRDEAGAGRTPGEIKKLKSLALLVRHRQFHVDQPAAFFDEQGRCHFTFRAADSQYFHTNGAPHYCRSDDMMTWSPLVRLTATERRSLVVFPRLLLDGKRAALIYATPQGGYLCSGTMESDGPRFGEPVRFVGPRTGVAGPCAVRLGGDLYLPAGERAAWLLKADWEAVMNGPLREIPGESPF